MPRDAGPSPLHPRTTARWAVATGLSGAAHVLRFAADALGVVADQLRVSLPREHDQQDDAPRRPPADTEEPLASAPEPSPPPPGGPDRRGPFGAPLRGPAAPAPTAARAERAQPVPTEPVPDAPRSRKSDSEIIELAERPARAVIDAVADLSTEELGWLYEYEQAHKKRKTVLEAITRSAGEHTARR